MKKKSIVIIVSVLTLSICILLIFLASKNKKENPLPNYQENNGQKEVVEENENPKPEEPVFCTQDVMKCPDGSYVGREAPDCKFKECPTSKFEIK